MHLCVFLGVVSTFHLIFKVQSLSRLAKNLPVLQVCTAAPVCLTPCWLRTQ